MELKTTECETVISVTADGLYSNVVEIPPFLIFGLRPHGWVSTWISMTTQTWMNRPWCCWLNPPSGFKLVLLQCQHCVCRFFFYYSPWNLPKVRVLILWIIFFFFFSNQATQGRSTSTKTRLWWTLNCTLICERAVKIVFQEPHKQRRQEPSFLFLLPLLCTSTFFHFFSPSTSFWCERIWY